MKTKTMPKTKTQKTLSLSEKMTNGAKSVPQEVQKPLKNSFYEKNKHLAGCLSSGVGDLSSNKEHLKGFGRSRNAGNR